VTGCLLAGALAVRNCTAGVCPALLLLSQQARWKAKAKNERSLRVAGPLLKCTILHQCVQLADCCGGISSTYSMCAAPRLREWSTQFGTRSAAAVPVVRVHGG
jgi:hypothetical protein